MAELKDICEASSPAAIAADATTGAALGTPQATPEAAPAEPAIAETVIAAAPQVETSQVEALKVETSQVEALKVETSQVEALKVESLKVETSEAEAAKAEGAKAEAPKIEAKMPPAQQLDPATSPAVPPIFLREHEQRARPRPPAPKVKAAPVSAREAKPKSRFGLLAATLAFSAGLGAAAGAVGVPLVAQSFQPATAAAPAGDTTAEAQAIKGMIAQLATDVSALRTAVEQSGKATTPVNKLAERLDRIERAQAEPAAKLAKIGEAIERLERRAQAPAAVPAQAVAPASDVTGSIPKPTATPVEAKPKPTIIEDYVVRKVFDGVALVEGRRGIIEVEPGMSLPGAGRVEEIRRQDGRWVVVTNKGLILSTR
jgi:hypothetical protein